MASLNGTIKRDLPTALGGHQEQEGSLGGFKHPGAPLPLTLLLNLWVEKRPNLGRTAILTSLSKYFGFSIVSIVMGVMMYAAGPLR